MNKLTDNELKAIKERVKNFNDDPQLYGVVMTVQEMNYLLSLLEEKDKALKESKETIMDLMREYPSECWTSMDVKSWEDNGNDAIKLIDLALNTSSNNEGES